MAASRNDGIIYDMKIIENNPYRLLGVFANSPTKERVANESKLKVFLKVGKQVTFPLDLPQFLPPVVRTIDTASDAEAKLTLPADQIKYAQFWFLNVTPVDKIAFRHLEGGDMESAIAIWSKAKNASSLQNQLVCYLMRKDYRSACGIAEQLYLGYASQFVSIVSGDGANVPTTLANDFLDVLCDEVGASVILGYVNNPDWKNHISAKTVSPIIARLQSAIDAAKATRGKGCQARYNAGVKLMNGTKKDFAQLRALLSSTDLQYQMIADKLGLEILQCGIDYYNDSEEPDAAHKAMVLQQYALSIVAGKMAKDRCQENVDILKKIIANLPPKEVFDEDKAIKNELDKFSKSPSKIDYAITLLNNSKPYLQSIKRKLGSNNSYYLKVSTIVVGNALSGVIAEVNDAQNDFIQTFQRMYGLASKDTLKSVILSAWEAMKLMKSFDMESEFKTRRFDPNLTTIKKICEDVGVPTWTGGKKLAIVIGVILLLVFFFLLANDRSTSSRGNSYASDSDTISLSGNEYNDSYDTLSGYNVNSGNSTDESVTQEDYYTESNDNINEYNEFIDNQLSTGSKPYAQFFGKATTGNNYFVFKTSGDDDYVVIIKWHGYDNVVNHTYIQGGKSARLYVPDGDFDVFFYSGKGWNPNKDNGRVSGGFVSRESWQKDEYVSVHSESVTYSLYPVTNGNLSLQGSNASEAL